MNLTDIAKNAPEGYRRSKLRALNPRSSTYVKEGTLVQRVARPTGGAIIGTNVGALAGIASKGRIPQKTASSLGGGVGYAIGRSKNVSSEDVVGINRKTGKRAKGSIVLPYTDRLYIY